jgi:SAM-dependent methyltransferase
MNDKSSLHNSMKDIGRFEQVLNSKAPFMVPSYLRQKSLFGDHWAAEFDQLIGAFAGSTDERLEKAIEGYVNFAVDGMRLQRKYEKSGRYEPKSYEEAGHQVYHNRDYMFGLYLPGILLSHYLWPHHYRQLQFFNRVIAPSIRDHPNPTFCDIGPGTGFYSRRFLETNERAEGWAFDISQSSLDYSKMQTDAFGVGARYHLENRNVISDPTTRQWPFLMSVEVLEHLEDPLSFLRAIRGMLEVGGRGFITAAVTAANEDHIYLYSSGDEVGTQMEEAGFTILDRQYDRAYDPKGEEPVPINAAFLVTR